MFWSALAEAVLVGFLGFMVFVGFPIIGAFLIATARDMAVRFTRRRRRRRRRHNN